MADLIDDLKGFMIVAVLFFGSVTAFRADIVTVTNTNDSGLGSLRDALAIANDGDTVDFAVTGTITLTSGRLMVDKSITISGPGAESLAVDGNAQDSIFYITSGVTVTISSLTITNGNSRFDGGGIYNQAATVTLDNCIISNNSAQYGGGIYNQAAIDDATLTVNNCVLIGNSVSAEGGGIYNFGYEAATVTVYATSFSQNSAGFSGGGVRNTGSNVTM